MLEMSTSENELLKIETFILKVHMNCEGCMNKVRKVLRKIEGVYKVDINAEEQKVIVVCRVNPTTLVQKLAKLGKHAEICSAGYNEEQANYVNDNKNMYQPQYVINDPNASENQYMIPTFGRDHWGPEWCLNQDMGGRDEEGEIDQQLAAPLFLEDVNNRTHHNFTRRDENPKWKESMITMMRPVSFQENGSTDYSSLGSQEWAQSPLLVSPISVYGHQTSPMTNIHGYYDNYHPSKMMQLYYYNHLSWGINLHMQEMPTVMRVIMNAHKHQEMTNPMFSSVPFNFYSY